MEIKPTKYSITDTPERKAVNTLRSMLDASTIKDHLEVGDKTPNYDGYFELTCPDQTPIGKIDVQVKKLGDDSLNEPQFQTDVGFLSFCLSHNLPVLLIVVDTVSEVAYWEWMSRDFIAGLNIPDGQQSRNIKFKKDNIIKKGDNSYYEEFKRIIEDEVKLRNQSEEYKKSYEIIAKNAEMTIGEEHEKYSEIHTFLDCLNYGLDHDFKVVKKVLFPDCWKLGVIILRYQPTDISFSLYPIPVNKNDIQIRFITKDITFVKRFSNVWTINYVNNPIKERPENYANEIIYKSLQQIIKYKQLTYCNEIIAREVIFHFVNAFDGALGITLKNNYSIDELLTAFRNYYPLWVEEVLKDDTIKGLFKDGCFHPGDVIERLGTARIEQISKIVQERVKKNEKCSNYGLGCHRYLKLAYDALTYLETLNVKNIERLFIAADWNREGAGNIIWSFWSREGIKNNLQMLFKEIVPTYDGLIKNQFSNSFNELRFYYNFDRVIVLVDKIKDNYENVQECPIIDYYFLENKEQGVNKIDLFFPEDADFSKYKNLNIGQTVVLDNVTYKVISWKKSILHFIFQPLPVNDFIYELLEDRIKNYFRKRKVQ